MKRAREPVVPSLPDCVIRALFSVLLTGAALVPPTAAQSTTAQQDATQTPAVQADSTQATGTIRGQIDHPMLRRWPAAVYVDSIEGITFPPPEANPVMDQINLRFTPHVLPVLVGSTIDFPNSDEIRHNVYTSTSSACQFELGIYDAGVVKHVTCDKPGVITLMCNVHAEMRGFIIVSPTPYFATTDRRGAFVIDGVPPGTYELTLEHERLASQTRTVAVTAGTETTVEFTGLGRKR